MFKLGEGLFFFLQAISLAYPNLLSVFASGFLIYLFMLLLFSYLITPTFMSSQ